MTKWFNQKSVEQIPVVAVLAALGLLFFLGVHRLFRWLDHSSLLLLLDVWFGAGVVLFVAVAVKQVLDDIKRGSANVRTSREQ